VWRITDWCFERFIYAISAFDDIARGWCKAMGGRRFIDIVCDMEKTAQKKHRSHKKKEK
jgi:hypothetical protein